MSTKNYKIKEIKLQDQPDEFLHKVCDLWDIQFRWYEKDDPLPDREQRIYNIRNPRPDTSVFSWFVFKDHQLIGDAGMGYSNEKSPSYEENKDTFGARIDILPEFRRQGIAKELLDIILDRAREIGRSVLQTGASLPEGWAFLENYLGAKLAQEGAENRVQVADLDWKMIDSWIEEGRSKNPETELIFFDRVPDNIIEQYVDMYSEVMNQMPKGDMEWTYRSTPEKRREDERRFEERDSKWFTYITQETDGTISGMTEMIYNTKQPYKINQELTGVRKDYRGRGLGKWLKAKMIHKIIAKYPDIRYIATGNASDNKPMLAINQRLGFRENRIWKGYKIKLQDLDL